MKSMSHDQEEQIVVFRLVDQIYGIEIGAVIEIIRMESITRLPGTPGFVEGIINLRGRVIPVIDLRNRFGLAVLGITTDSRIIIVETVDVTIGIVVDAVAEVLRYSPAGVLPPPAMLDGDGTVIIRGIILDEDRMVILLNNDNILGASEVEDLNRIQAEKLAV